MDSVNFLAHLHLADPEPGLMLGGIVADFATNPEVAALPADVQRGVRLHRLVDGFTDRHPLVQRSVSRMSRRLGWFSGIAIDIYYDHILARDWARYSTEPLQTFANRAYQVLEDAYPFAPIDAQHFIRRFIDNNQLFEYSTAEGIKYTLGRVSRRIAERIPKKAIWLPDALPDLQHIDTELSGEFHVFYPELIGFAKRSRGELAA
jgi:acyl carrier protein phosphodiesterase